MVDILGDILSAVKGRQDQQRIQATQTTEISRAASDVKTTYADRSGAVESDILNRRKKAEDARRLSESGSFWDMATLAGKAMLDPDYDPRLRANRNAEDANYLNLLGTTTNIQLEALQSKLQVGEATLNAAQVNENIALEKADTAAKMKEIQTRDILATSQLQDAQMSAMTPEDIGAALKTPRVAGTPDHVVYNGVEIPRFKLTQRSTDLEHQRVGQLLVQKADNDAERALGQETIIRSKSLNELSRIRAQNYVSDGMALDPVTVDKWYNTKTQNETDFAADEVKRIGLANQPQGVITSAGELVNRLGASLPKDSPMQTHLRTFKSTVGMSQALVETGAPVQQAAGIASVNAGLQSYDKAAKEQALKDAPTDKEMQAARYEYYMSGEIPTERVASVAVSRLAANKPMVGVLNTEDETLLRNLYREVKTQMVSEASSGDFGKAPTQSEMKELQSQAAITAWDKFKEERGGQIADSAFEGMANVAAIPGTNVTPNPLYGKESQLQFRRKVVYARQRADETLMQSLGLSQDQLDKIMSSGVMPEGSKTDIFQFKATRDHAIAVSLMSQYTPEQGKALVDWMAVNGDTYIGSIVDNAASGAGGFENAASVSLAKDAARDNFYQQIDSLSRGLDSALAEPAEQISNFAFGNPEPYQAVALQMSKDLTDQDRTMLWTKYIAPTVLKAQEQGLRGKDAHNFIERQLGNLQMQTPEEKKAWKTFQRDRKESVENINNMMNGWFFFLPRTGLTSSGNLLNPSGQVREVPMMGSPEGILDRSANAIPFYKEYLKLKPKATPK